MTTTADTTLYAVVANLLLQPLLQYLLHSRCTHAELCCIKCERTLLEALLMAPCSSTRDAAESSSATVSAPPAAQTVLGAMFATVLVLPSASLGSATCRERFCSMKRRVALPLVGRWPSSALTRDVSLQVIAINQDVTPQGMAAVLPTGFGV